MREAIRSTGATITGSFSREEAVELANVLNNPLDLPLVVRSQYEVGPTLAADAVTSGERATVIGAATTDPVGFYGTAGVTQQVAPVTLADVITVLHNLGLTA